MLWFALIAVVVMIGAYAAVIRGGLGLLSKRLADDPALDEQSSDEERDGLPIDIEY